MVPVSPGALMLNSQNISTRVRLVRELVLNKVPVATGFDLSVRRTLTLEATGTTDCAAAAEAAPLSAKHSSRWAPVPNRRPVAAVLSQPHAPLWYKRGSYNSQLPIIPPSLHACSPQTCSPARPSAR